MDSHKRILHIEDDSDLRKYILTLFEDIADIDRSDSIQLSKQLLTDRQYNLIILDMTLPDGSGMEIINFLNSNKIKLPVIILSAHDVIDNLPNVERVFLKNRHNTEDLVERVHQLLKINT